MEILYLVFGISMLILSISNLIGQGFLEKIFTHKTAQMINIVISCAIIVVSLWIYYSK
jgi:hypothetical protein